MYHAELFQLCHYIFMNDFRTYAFDIRKNQPGAQSVIVERIWHIKLCPSGLVLRTLKLVCRLRNHFVIERFFGLLCTPTLGYH